MLIAPAAEARQGARPVIDAGAGWVGFADDGVVSEAMAGGAARWQVTPRISIGPEVIYIQGDRHHHLVITGNVTFDLLSASPTPPPIQPFIVAGGGLFSTTEAFSGETFTSQEGAFTAGGGVRGRLSDHVSLGIDARVGWELHLRVGAFVAIR